jgi:predicted DNA-binding protein
MRKTITIRLPDDLDDWLTSVSRKTGVPKGRIVREELEKARIGQVQPFMKWVGSMRGPEDLSMRKGFSRP